MADIRLNNRLDVSLLRASYDKRLIAAPPEEIQPNTTLAWHIDGEGSVSYNLSSTANGTGGPVRRFTLEWTLSPAGEVQCRARDAARSLRIEVEQRPDGALCTVAARNRRVPPPPRRGRVLARLIPIVAGAVIVALVAGTLAALGSPSSNHRVISTATATATSTSTVTPTPTPTSTPTSTPVPPHAKLVVSKNRSYNESCTQGTVNTYIVTLDNRLSNVPVGWRFPASAGWASATPSGGIIAAGHTATLEVTPHVCPGIGAKVTYTATLALSFPQGGFQPNPQLSDTISGPSPHPNLKVTQNQYANAGCYDSGDSIYTLTIDNLGGNVPVTWQFVPQEKSGGSAPPVPWATASPSNGTVMAGQGATEITISPAQWTGCGYGDTYHATLHLTFPGGGAQADIPLTDTPG